MSNPVPLIGPLQVRVMDYIWQHGPSTVHAVHDALNATPGAQKLAYTTILTVMRNLARRKVLEQKANGRSHTFVPLVKREAYRAMVALYVRDTFFGGSAAELIAAVNAATQVEDAIDAKAAQAVLASGEKPVDWDVAKKNLS